MCKSKSDGIRQGNGDAEAQLAQKVHGFIWRQDVAHQMGEEPMGQVAPVEVGAQGAPPSPAMLVSA